jgi:hypothetical protein
MNVVQVGRLQTALANLSDAIRNVQAVLQELGTEHDPLASHIFVARRAYRHIGDTKSGKRREVAARLSWQQACDLGFRGSLTDWERLLGAQPKR